MTEAIRNALKEGLENKLVKNLDLSGMDLTGWDFSDARLEKVNMRNAELERAYFNNAHLLDCNLSGVRWRSGTLWESRFDRCNLSEVAFNELTSSSLEDKDPPSLNESVFVDCVLNSSDLMGCDVWGATFEKCEMQGVSLSLADVRSAKFKDSDLRGSDLIKLKGISKGTWKGVDLTGANLGKHRKTTFKGARFDSKGEYISVDVLEEQRKQRQIETMGAVKGFLKENRNLFTQGKEVPSSALDEDREQAIEEKFSTMAIPSAKPDQTKAAFNKEVKKYGEALRLVHKVEIAEDAGSEAFVFSPDGATIRAYSEDGVISTVQLSDYTRIDDQSVDLAELEPHKLLGFEVFVSPQGAYVAWTGANEVWVFDANTLERVGAHKVPDLCDVGLADDGELFVACEKKAERISLEGKRKAVKPPIKGATKVTCSADNTLVAFASDTEAVIIDRDSGKFGEVLTRAKDDWCSSLFFSADARYLLANCKKGLEVWELGGDTQAKCHGFKDYAYFAAAGDIALGAMDNKDLRCINLQTAKTAAKQTIDTTSRHAVAVSPDKRTIAVLCSSYDGSRIQFWQALAENVEAKAEAPASKRTEKKKSATKKKGPSAAAVKKWVKSLKCKKLGPLKSGAATIMGAPAGERLLYLSDRGIIALDQANNSLKSWKKNPPDSLPVVLEHEKWFSQLAVSADGNTAALMRSGDDSSYCAIVDLTVGKTIAEWTGEEYFRCCCISADGSYAAFGTSSGVVVTYSARANTFTAEKRHDSVLRCVAISPESNTLVSSCLSDKMIVSSMSEPAEPLIYEIGDFTAAYFLADDLVLIAAGDGAHAIGVWDGITRWSKKLKKGCTHIREAPHGTLAIKQTYSPKTHFITREGKSLGSVELKGKNGGVASDLLFLDETTAFATSHDELLLIKGKPID